jgi:Trk K+ transport system NAD-binding subunit
MRPTKHTVLEDSDVVVGVGSPDEIRMLEELFEPQDSRV